MKEVNYYRVYDEQLDLLYETRIFEQTIRPTKLEELLQRSVLFLNVGNIACYRIVPVLKA